MAKSTKGIRNSFRLDCPNPKCGEELELTFQGESYRHYLCRNCNCSVEMPIKEKKK